MGAEVRKSLAEAERKAAEFAGPTQASGRAVRGGAVEASGGGGF